ncbi:hypothetical protein M427DRAFT_52652 [Gonapodya prolifera JEL478]|uniref:G-patch domain-containing protein n=1 Tax=Gonapodya prolifera (strain JEL478) TaxID=1344416 RepID=A0A139ATG5_GONPJ|nr:hypothetical protein M427DRAFT_52652 [Gonapodya prolifera JEL478]|eukprot:KXS19785.1 hypothetical protein M427DRAFT_52652 [Gonapodya prolifera JEL478]
MGTVQAPTFAEQQLLRYGWSRGTGLGKRRDGMTRHITVGYKNDTKGLGAQQNDFGFAWWDHLFNASSASITVNRSDGEVSVASSGDARRAAGRKELYGGFVKADLTAWTYAGSEGKNEMEDAKRRLEEEEKKFSTGVTDKELFEACEGRTAHKGARAHVEGKLARVDKGLLLEAKDKTRSSEKNDNLFEHKTGPPEKVKRNKNRTHKSDTRAKASVDPIEENAVQDTVPDRRGVEGDRGEIRDVEHSAAKAAKKEKKRRLKQLEDTTLEGADGEPLKKKRRKDGEKSKRKEKTNKGDQEVPESELLPNEGTISTEASVDRANLTWDGAEKDLDAKATSMEVQGESGHEEKRKKKKKRSRDEVELGETMKSGSVDELKTGLHNLRTHDGGYRKEEQTVTLSSAISSEGGAKSTKEKTKKEKSKKNRTKN